ncbi:hypothetical protein FOA52_002201 [Chlamydomonas sp. UWO 241]|nr:hypothetical protein FOA52_002201 [Chlamydomonas sp. UWO 241]
MLRVWNLVHGVSGYATAGLAAANVYIGLSVYSKEFNPPEAMAAWYVPVTVMLVLALTAGLWLEFWKRRRRERSEYLRVMEPLLFQEQPLVAGHYFRSQDYPQKPLLVQFLTSGGGTVRFNPNLYVNGKVCLSLLGTWSGPSWQPGTSTLLQVLLSISALVIVPGPFFNEPSYEGMLSMPQGQARSKAYNEGIRCHTLKTAVLLAAQAAAGMNPGSGLPGWATCKEAITAYYRAKRTDIQRTCNAWVIESSEKQTAMESTTESIKHALARLAP